VSGPPAGSYCERADYPLVVVTCAGADGERSGCLVGFTTQCSIEPMRFLVCLSKANHTYQVATRAPSLAVHLLGAAQHDLARLFGEETGDEVDKFARCAWHLEQTGAPILDECAAFYEGTILSRLDVGDHVAHLLAPAGGGAGASQGVLSFQEGRSLEAAHEAD
jgi:flavin reductase (DIM6/NTAB) family NADH-FMN oxidoreductase RutF